jgi:tRNA1Val (adenine37-N6)-methyltransferase
MAKERIFRFKQFSVVHEVNAMKVCTEACILGAFAPVEEKKRILDIGTGTGLLALMSAQRSQAQILGLELLKEFSVEAKENVQRSPWNDRIEIVNQSFESFADQTNERFDFIIANPPFYTHQLPSKDQGKNLAWHSQSFDHENFVSRMDRILTSDGQICLLLPLAETEYCIRKAAEISLGPTFQLLIKNRPELDPFRVITIFERKIFSSLIRQEFVIYQELTQYTQSFIDLLRPYYTIFE